jgi:quercetin dioxygenase-like cupin family protein
MHPIITRARIVLAAPLLAAAVVGLSLTAVAVAGQPSRPVADTLATGDLPAGAETTIVAPDDKRSAVDVRQVRTIRFTLAPGGAFPWHQHPGPVWAVVTKGTLTYYDASCQPRTYPAGETFFDVGTITHTARNEGSEPLEVIATFMFPADAGPAASVPQPAPATCAIEV